MKLPLRSFFTQAALVLGGGIALSSCIQRPLGTDQPKTTNVIVDNLKQSSVDKIDMLFVIDNSLSMGDKQVLLAQALPDLVERLVDPVCINDGGMTEPPTGGQCPQGYAREFQPINNIHIGVVTSSLGGFGAATDCTETATGDTDNAYLLGSLPRVQAEIPGTPPFLSWCLPGSDSAANGDCAPTPETHDGNADLFSEDFADQVRAAKEFGCGWEATLEAWYRFLIEPYPWTKVVRQDCPFGGDSNQLCVGPERDENLVPYLDTTILEQRKQFLRADSLLAIVMLTDENDCSFKASGQSWRLSQTRTPIAAGSTDTVANKAYKGSTACQTDPNGACCVSCGTTSIPAGCPTGTNPEGATVNAGCEEPRYPSADDLNQAGLAEPTEDAVNLRCFNHKQRFGVDYLYPVERYSNALKKLDLCPFAETLDPEALNSNNQRICTGEQLVQNPLYIDLSYEDRRAMDPLATPVVARSEDLVFLAGIVGVPWQNLAVDPNAPVLEYKTNRQSAIPGEAPSIDWVQLLGNATIGADYDLLNAPPGEPLMREQIEQRTGTDANVNGGEWNVIDRDDLQYACIFPLNTPVECPDINDTGAETVACDCTYYGNAEYDNPLCMGNTQTHAKAYPSIRPLQVLRDFGGNSIVASICPKETTNEAARDYGYRPAVAAIVDRLKEQLKDKCLSRKLEVKEVEGGRQANCLIIEANTSANSTCSEGEARRDVQTEEIKKKVWERLERTNVCTDVNGDCQQYHLCEILPIAPGTGDYDSCLNSDNPSGNGWCYVDPEQQLGDEDQVEKCAETEKRKIRFAGQAAPKKGTVTFFACAGAPEGVSAEAVDGAAGAGAM